MSAIKLTSPKRTGFCGLETARQILLIALLLLPCTGLGQSTDFVIDWFGTAGGGASSGGDFELSATVGEPDAGQLAGDDFALTGGFWSIALPPDPLPVISLRVSLANAVVSISWPEGGSAGFALEETDALVNPPGNTTWITVNVTPESSNGTKTVRLPLASGKRFYRLHHP